MIHFVPPPYWHLGPLTVNCHSLAFCLGAVAAYLWTFYRLPKVLRDHIDNLAAWMTLAGIAGARLLYMVINYQNFANPLRFFAFWEGGLVSYGGFIGAVAAWIIYIKYNKLDMNVFANALGPAAVLGWGVGRFGCFLNWHGEYGKFTDLPWGFIVGSDAARHPVMLYLALGHCAAALLAAHLAPKLKINAAGIALFAFGAVRFVLDYWRDYQPSWLYFGSLGICTLFMVLGIWLCRKLSYPDTPENTEAVESAAPETTAP